MPELQLVLLPPSRCLRANNGCTSSENNHLSSVTPPPPAAVPSSLPILSPSPLTPRALFCHRRRRLFCARPAKGVCQMLQIRDTDGDILEFIGYDDARGSKPLFILDGLRLVRQS